MKIRYASKHDVEAVRALYRILFADMAAMQPQYIQEGEAAYDLILGTIRSGTADILLAVEGEEMLGFALVREEKTPPYSCMVSHRYAYLMDLVVAPGGRGKGVGTSLLQAVKNWSRERELEYVELNSLWENEGATRLYQREGFQDVMRTMRCPVEA